MKALLLSQFRLLELADLPAPGPGRDEVLVRVAACGICRRDIHSYDGSSDRGVRAMVTGHERAGTIAASGKNVKGFAVGGWVAFDSTVSWGACERLYACEPNLMKVVLAPETFA